MRALLLAAFACVVVGAGTAQAETRLRVAVLGLEVSGAVDEMQTVVARELTAGMRGRARIGNGPYAYAPNSERELIDEKLIKACDSEAVACMSAIARDLGADMIVYGKVTKESDGYRVRLNLLDAGKPARVKNIEVLAGGMTSAEDARVLATTWYDDLVGSAGAGGTLALTANVDVGTVLVDEQIAGRLSDGKLSVELAEGHHVIAVEAPGHARKELKITVKRGETLQKEVSLVTGSPGRREPIDIWRPTFIVSGSLTAVLGVYGVYLFASWKGSVGDLRAAKPDDPMTPNNESMEPISAKDCDGPNASAAVTVDEGGVLSNLCSTRDRQGTITWLAAGVGVVAVISGVMWYRDRQAKTKSKEGRGMAVIPTLSRETAGATLELRW